MSGAGEAVVAGARCELGASSRAGRSLPASNAARDRSRSSGSSSSSASSSSGSSSSSSSDSTASRRSRRKSAGCRPSRAEGVEAKVEEISSSEDESEASDLDAEQEVDLENNSEFGIYKDLLTNRASQHRKDQKEDGYSGDWTGAPTPGSVGFNGFAADAMKKAGVASKPAPKLGGRGSACPPLQPHQEAVAFLLHPSSPVTRLLVDHPTGSGKTREMISVLDNFFGDPRPKVPIFPKEPVCCNFYMELLRWPSRYRDFFSCMRPRSACLASGSSDWRPKRCCLWSLAGLPDRSVKDLCAEMREVLEMKGWFFMGYMRRSARDAFQRKFPGEAMPQGPLRALRYTSAGGRHTELRNGMPVSALLKVAFDHAGKNVYSNKIVIMDEVHNLVRSQTQYSEQLERLRGYLTDAEGMVLAGFTGTPMLNERSEGRKLLDIIKGGSRAVLGDEGFLSSFHVRPAGLFPSSFPAGIPDSILTAKLRRRLVCRVTLTGEPLQKYEVKSQRDMSDRRLRSYCNLCVHFGSLHEGRSGTKLRVLGDMEGCAPKLHRLGQEILACNEKQLVLISRSSGMDALIDHLRHLAAQADPPFGVATIEELAAFNSADNLRGEIFRVLVADSITCSEGVSFFAVRHLHLADVPASPSALVQSVGRAIRMYGHRGLPPEEQTVTTRLYIAGLPRWMRCTLACWAFRAQRRNLDPHEQASQSRRLLRRLAAAGIRDLKSLKARLDRLQGHTETRPRLPLDTSQVVNFIESLGLWEEAKSIRLRLDPAAVAQRTAREQRRQQKKASLAMSNSQRPAAAEGPALKEEGTTLSQPSSQDQPEGEAAKIEAAKSEDSGQRQAAKVRKPASKAHFTPQAVARSLLAISPPQFGSTGPAAQQHSWPPPATDGDVPLGSLASAAVRRPAQSASSMSLPEASEASVGEDPAWLRDQLVCSLQVLALCSTAAEAEELLHLSRESADEQALKGLAALTREFVPALAELRTKAIDRPLLQGLEGVAQKKDEESEGESSAYEFLVSDSGGELQGGGGGSQAVKKRKEGGLVLPPGWRIEKVRRNKRECKEFVDDRGRRYQTIKEARVAIAKVRSLQNMQERLAPKFAAKFGAASAAAPAPKVEEAQKQGTPEKPRIKKEIEEDPRPVAESRPVTNSRAVATPQKEPRAAKVPKQSKGEVKAEVKAEVNAELAEAGQCNESAPAGAARAQAVEASGDVSHCPAKRQRCVQ